MRYNLPGSVSIFFLSLSIIALQVAYIRILSVTRAYHFSYLVISTALLGFGASGTLLSFIYHRIESIFVAWLLMLFLLFTISLCFSFSFTQRLPIDIRYLLYNRTQPLLLLLFDFVIFIPFFLGAMIIGSLLIYFRDRAALVYGANLIGSGVGGVAVIGLLYLFSPGELPGRIAFLAWISFALWIWASYRYYSPQLKVWAIVSMSVALVPIGLTWMFSPELHIDPYKPLKYLLHLEEQGDARHLLSRSGPRAQFDVFSSTSMHQTLFAGIQSDTMPPEQLSLLLDGDGAGTLFKIQNPNGADIMDFTPQSVPYRLVDRPRVLLLGEVGGINIWLAERFEASEILVVQSNRQITAAMKNELREIGGDVFFRESVTVINQEPRLFIEQTVEQFDIIQIVTAEGMPANTRGLYSLHEDHTLTVESLSRCIKNLTNDGLLTITRGIQFPPKDNIKIFALCAEALAYVGVQNPENHLVQSRNYLAVNTLVSKKPFSKDVINRIQNICGDLLMDLDFYPGIDSESITQINEVEGPPGTSYSYYHEAAREILFGNRNEFYGNWMYKIRPPKDNSPYFHNFFKWQSLSKLIQMFGRNWFQRLELGYVVLAFTGVEVTVFALILIILPLFIRKKEDTPRRTPTIMYFAAIGFGFMFIEIVCIQKLTYFLGDQIYSTAATLTAILVCAGLGSIFQEKLSVDVATRIRIATGILVIVILIGIFALDPILALFIRFHVAVRFIVVFVTFFPVSFLMGWFFSSGILILKTKGEALVPLAWGVNGFASVAASPFALMLAMSFGYGVVILCAMGLYIIAGSISFLLGATK